ncbi:MAG: PrgI family protein [bacterium]|nr:PrgI family protein [bacterium]
MDQHPVPQNISSYEFRLVGDMTLKQFFQLAGGIGLGLVFYRTPLPGLVKWPLSFIAVLGGILLAFVPLQGRPFSQWLTAFFKAVYSPTQYYWSPVAEIEAPVAAEPSASSVVSSSPIDKLESQLFSKFSDLFNTITHFPSTSRSTPPPATLPAEPEPFQPLAAPAPLPTTPVAPIPTPPANSLPAKDVSPFSVISALTPTVAHSPLTGTAPTASQTAAAALLTPTRPNILAGVVVDGQGQPAEGAIMEIAEKDSGLPVRALRSNKLGQFQIATPLADNEYVITTDKEGLVFEPLLISVRGQILPPFEVKAKSIS